MPYADNGSARLHWEERGEGTPVVLVHGLLSNAATWTAYTRSGGLLARTGLHGFAVGDGQAPGALNTGNLAQPTAATLPLRANAAQLAQYIAGVRRATGAEMVDLVAHSMGGLIARFYIDRLMDGRDVAQLLTLGTPHGGSDCAATHFLRPATDSAPAGSMIVRVSSKTSLIAAQIASLSTSTTSSTVWLAMAKVCTPTSRTATPSANSPTLSSATRVPASSDRAMASASTGSTPMMRTAGRTALMYAAIPASNPPPPTGTKIASRSTGR